VSQVTAPPPPVLDPPPPTTVGRCSSIVTEVMLPGLIRIDRSSGRHPSAWTATLWVPGGKSSDVPFTGSRSTVTCAPSGIVPSSTRRPGVPGATVEPPRVAESTPVRVPESGRAALSASCVVSCTAATESGATPCAKISPFL